MQCLSEPEATWQRETHSRLFRAVIYCYYDARPVFKGVFCYTDKRVVPAQQAVPGDVRGDAMVDSPERRAVLGVE